MPGQVPKYIGDPDDLLDQHIAYYLRHHSDVHARSTVVRKRPGVYDVNVREVFVEWQYAEEPGGQGHLVVIDGPLRQPFTDYMEGSDSNAEYKDPLSPSIQSALHKIPKDERLTFEPPSAPYSRYDAMMVAKEQAIARQAAAEHVKEGLDIPSTLISSYNRTITEQLNPVAQRNPDAMDHESAKPAAVANPYAVPTGGVLSSTNVVQGSTAVASSGAPPAQRAYGSAGSSMLLASASPPPNPYGSAFKASSATSSPMTATPGLSQWSQGGSSGLAPPRGLCIGGSPVASVPNQQQLQQQQQCNPYVLQPSTARPHGRWG